MRNIIKHPLHPGISETEDILSLNPKNHYSTQVNPTQPTTIGKISMAPLSSPQVHSLEAAGATHIGLVRQSNEDCFYLDTFETSDQDSPLNHPHLQGVFILCDGMGGHEQGEVASSIATFQLAQILMDHKNSNFVTELGLKSSIYQTNQTIHQENLQLHQLGLGRMGTTAVVAALQDRTVRIGHVGDSRCYRVTRSFGLEQLTLDHELGQLKISKGIDPKIAYSDPNAYALTQALGPRPNHMIAPDVRTLNMKEDSLFLLCSDGLSDNHLVETSWLTHLQPYLSKEQSLSQGATGLVNLALRHNGHDNITVVLFRALL